MANIKNTIGRLTLVVASGMLVAFNVQAEDDVTNSVDTAIDAVADSSVDAVATEVDATASSALSAEAESVPELVTPTPVAPVAEVTAPVASSELPSKVVATKSLAASDAATALKSGESDASSKKNLEEVFNQNKTYSLAKKGSYSASFDADYSFYRDSRIDIATADGSSTLLRFRVEDDAQHTISNNISVQYGLKDNLSFGVSIPLIAKVDSGANKNAFGLGDIGLNLRWEPYELERNKLPLTISANLSTKTGDSPYEIPPEDQLSTGKGYYSFGGGLSTRKYFDPVVLFASGSLGYGLPVTGLNQIRGSKILTSFQPGLNFGFAIGYAYSLNYDVSITMSYSQGFSALSEYNFTDGSRVVSGLQTSGSLTSSLGIRISPKTLVNTSLTFGLTEDAPDVSLGVSVPLDFIGFGKKVK